MKSIRSMMWLFVCYNEHMAFVSLGATFSVPSASSSSSAAALSPIQITPTLEEIDDFSEELGEEAVWSLSSAKPCNGIDQLRDNDLSIQYPLLPIYI